VISLCSCSPALINVQGVKSVPAATCPKPVAEKICAPVLCPVLDMPARVPDNVVLEISNGKVVTMNAGGEELLRNFIATRKAIAASWQK